MKSIKLVILSTLVTLGIFLGVFYTSCTKDSCKAVTCINGGSCSGGLCNCKLKGTGGQNCEIVYRNLYSNTYTGNGGPDDSGGLYHNNTFQFVASSDSDYTQMQLVWTNPGVRVVTFPITLTTNTASGSTFTVKTTNVGTLSWSGTGSVSKTLASLSVVQTDTGKHPIAITLNNFIKQ